MGANTKMDEWFDTIDINVPWRKGVKLKPYVAKISGPHPKYKYARRFLRTVRIDYYPEGRLFTYLLPCDGVYERCVRTIDKTTGKVLDRDRDWFILFDGEEVEIQFQDIQEALDDLEGVCLRKIEE